MSVTTGIIPEATKRIAYNATHDNYDCFITIDGGGEQYIGSANTYHEAETRCSSYAYDYYSDNHTPEKAVQIALFVDIPDTFLAPADLPDQPIGALADGTTIYGIYSLSRDSIAALQVLFTSGMLEHLLVAAERWESGAALPSE